MISSVRGSWLLVYVSYVFELPEVEEKLFHGKAEMERVVFLMLEVAHNLMQKGSPEEHSTPYRLPFGRSPCLIKADSQICDLSARDQINAF